MKNFFKGFIVGIGKIIPGVSGAMLAMAMGIYDKALNYICNFKNNKVDSIKYLVPIGLGVLLSIIFFSKIISLALNSFYVITMLFFIGLIIGGVPFIVNKVYKKDYFIVVIAFILFFLISIGNVDNVYIIKNNIIDYIVFFISGVIEVIGTIVPGVSSTALLMIVGTYNDIINSIGNFSNMGILIPFGLGIVTGSILIIKLINYLINKYENKLYAFVLGILLSSIIILIIQSFRYNVKFLELIVGLIFMIIGILIASLLKEK